MAKNMKRREQVEGFRWRVETTIGFSALAVALAGIVMAAIDSFQNRRLQRLSVQPDLAIKIELQRDLVGWQVRNAGLGVAKLYSVQAYIDDEPVKLYDDIFESFGMKAASVESTLHGRGARVLPNQVTPLILVSSSPAMEKIRNSIGRLRWRFCYCSLLDDCWDFFSDRQPTPTLPVGSCDGFPDPMGVRKSTWINRKPKCEASGP